jgi:hypothetical protein
MRRHLPDLPVIILTGSLEPMVPEDEEPRRVVLIKKPVRLSHLDSTIAQVARTAPPAHVEL